MTCENPNFSLLSSVMSPYYVLKSGRRQSNVCTCLYKISVFNVYYSLDYTESNSSIIHISVIIYLDTKRFSRSTLIYFRPSR